MDVHESFNVSISFLSVKGYDICLLITNLLQNVLDIYERSEKKTKLIFLAKEKELKCPSLYFYLKDIGVNYKDPYKNPCKLQTVLMYNY